MSLRNRFERFCYKHRNKGIPNLALIMAIGTFLVTLCTALGFEEVYDAMMFDFSAILQGQVWRLITFIFTIPNNVFTALLMLYFFTSLGRAVENHMGTFKFNLFFFSGILLMDLFGMCFGGYTIHNGTFIIGDCSGAFAHDMAFMLYLTIVLCFSTVSPDSQFLLFFIFPIKAWILSLIYFIYFGYIILNGILNSGYFPQYLFPLVGFANYFLFFGKDAINLIPLSWRVKRGRKFHKPANASVVNNGHKPKAAAYNHRCTICGRTDASHPNLEFRYCSRCNGYFCYCEEHISNHTHVE